MLSITQGGWRGFLHVSSYCVFFDKAVNMGQFVAKALVMLIVFCFFRCFSCFFECFACSEWLVCVCLRGLCFLNKFSPKTLWFYKNWQNMPARVILGGFFVSFL